MPELVLDVEGPAAPPRENGELVFRSPWESRVFGLTAALVEQEQLSWPDMQAALIVRIGEADRVGRHDYWGSWLAALGDVLAARDVLEGDQVARRLQQLADRPAGHDHDHPHDHEH